MRKLFYWAFAFSLCVLMGCKDDGVRVEVVRYAINEPVFMSINSTKPAIRGDAGVSEFSEGDG